MLQKARLQKIYILQYHLLDSNMKYVYELIHARDRRGGVIVWYLDLQLPI